MQKESINENAKEIERDPGPYITWDTRDIIKYHAEYLREEDETLSEEKAWDLAAQDYDLFEHEWDCLLESLERIMKEINEDGYWHVRAEDFGWQNLSGWTKFQTDSAKTFLQKILPNTDCTFHIFVVGEGDQRYLSIQNYHHDSPMGEWYYARPISAAKFYGENEDDYAG